MVPRNTVVLITRDRSTITLSLQKTWFDQASIFSQLMLFNFRKLEHYSYLVRTSVVNTDRLRPIIGIFLRLFSDMLEIM